MEQKLFYRVVLVIIALGLLPMALSAGGTPELREGRIVLYADMVRGHTNPTLGPTCALSSRYLPGEMIVWRIRVFDTLTDTIIPKSTEELIAELPDEAALAALMDGIKVTVHLSDGQSFPAHFGPHGGEIPLDYFWTTSWEISNEYPTGTLDYWITVEVSESGKSARYEPFAIPTSKLTIVEPEA